MYSRSPALHHGFDSLSLREREALHRNGRRMQTRAGNRFMKRRAEHAERSFPHTLDRSRLRRTTLRGKEDLDKRHPGICAGFNFSRLMRRRCGAGTPKMLAIQLGLFGLLICTMMTLMTMAAQPATSSTSGSFRRRAA